MNGLLPLCSGQSLCQIHAAQASKLPHWFQWVEQCSGAARRPPASLAGLTPPPPRIVGRSCPAVMDAKRRRPYFAPRFQIPVMSALSGPDEDYAEIRITRTAWITPLPDNKWITGPKFR
jgi:hypothetical protein